MLHHPVISLKILPTQPPLSLSINAILLIKVYELSGIITGIIYTLIFLLWLSFFVSSFYEDKVNIFETKEK